MEGNKAKVGKETQKDAVIWIKTKKDKHVQRKREWVGGRKWGEIKRVKEEVEGPEKEVSKE